MMYVTPAMLFGCGAHIHLHDSKKVWDGRRILKHKAHVHKRLYIVGVPCLMLSAEISAQDVVFTNSLFSGRWNCM
jgi:hypothetical protein